MPVKHPQLDVLYEDNHLLAVVKPAMLPTMGVTSDRECLLDRAKEYVRRNYNKPGNVYLGVVSRLDAPVTGVVLLARTSKAASRLNEQFRTRAVEKTYWALMDTEPDPAKGELQHYLRHDDRHRRVHVTHAQAPDAKLANLQYKTISTNNKTTLIEIQPITGRKHQIRVQFAKIDCPIVGDRKYGSSAPFPHGIALHARRLIIEHPVQKQPITLQAPLPVSWKRFVLPKFMS